MTETPADPSNAPESAAEVLADFDPENKNDTLIFFVGWQSGKAYDLKRLKLHVSVEREFRSIAKNILTGEGGAKGVLERESTPWAPDAQIFPETYLECGIDDVGEFPKLVRRPKDERILEVLRSAEKLDELDAKDLESKRLGLYGFSMGQPEEQIVFLRRANPRRSLRSGRFMGRFSDTLQRIDDPVFAFDGVIDLIVAGERLVILSQNAFFKLFRGQAELKALVPKWGETLREHFPVEEESLKRLVAKAGRDSRHRQRLEAIVARGHLNDLNQEDLKSAMEDCGLDPDSFFNESGELCVEEGGEADLLYFLNEDLYRGLITGDQFRADKKASV